MYKEDELAKCLIAFDGATQGNNFMTFEDFEVALEHAGKQKKMSGSDVRADHCPQSYEDSRGAASSTGQIESEAYPGESQSGDAEGTCEGEAEDQHGSSTHAVTESRRRVQLRHGPLSSRKVVAVPVTLPQGHRHG